MLQNVQMALEYLRFKKVNNSTFITNSCKLYINLCLFIDQTGEHSGRRYCRWQPKTHAGSHMDYHTSFPG